MKRFTRWRCGAGVRRIACVVFGRRIYEGGRGDGIDECIESDMIVTRDEWAL